MPNAVLDTNVLVSGLLTPGGNPARIIDALKARRFSIFYNAEINSEYRDVLSRKRLGLNAPDVSALLEAVSALGYNAVADKSSVPLPDEDDRVFYDAAKASRAYLVKGNLKHFPAEPFIVSPAAFAAALDG